MTSVSFSPNKFVTPEQLSVRAKIVFAITEYSMVVAILLLFLCISYSRFNIFSEIYHPLFLASFDTSLYPGDIFVADHFFRHSAIAFYVLLGAIGNLGIAANPILVLYWLFILTNLLGLWALYRLGDHFGGKVVALFFVIVMFTPFEFLRGANVSVAHPLFSGTACAFPFAVFSVLSLLERKYIRCLVALLIAASFSVKTGFAVGLPVGLIMLHNLVFDRDSRTSIIRAAVCVLPAFTLLVGFVLLGRDGSSLCREIFQLMIEREGDEADVIKSFSWIAGRPYYYVGINAISIWIVSRQRASQFTTQVFGLLVASNLLLVLGICISLLYGIWPLFQPLMLVPWPKLAFVPTLISVGIICNLILGENPNWLPRVNKYCLLLLYFGCFLALLNVDLFETKHQVLRWLLILFLFLIAAIRTSSNNSKVSDSKMYSVAIMVMGLTFSQVAVAMFNVRNIYQEGVAKTWPHTFYRPPGEFVQSQWELSKWLNNEADDGALAVYLKYEGDKYLASNLRRYSTVPMYLTGKVTDIYGSCERHIEVKRRTNVVKKWVLSGNSTDLISENVRWVIVGKRNWQEFNDQNIQREFENSKFVVFRLR